MTEEQWSNLTGRAGAVLNYGIEEKEWLKSCKMAKLIAATPILAGCEKAEETAFSHLMIYLISQHESAKGIFLHKPSDDKEIYTRLFPITSFLGGNAGIINCSLDLIALCMISNYHNDAEEDKQLGKYNPLNEGKWDYTTESEKLLSKIENNMTPEIAAIYTAEDALRGVWGN